MSTIRVRKTVESETLHLPELRPLIGKTVEIVIQEEPPAPATANDGQPLTDTAGEDGKKPRLPRERALALLAFAALVIGALVLLLLSRPLEDDPRSQTRNELAQLDEAVKAFKTDFSLGSGNFPSRLKLCENLAYYDTFQKLDQDSISFLLRLFPRMRATWADPKGGIDWNGNGKIDPANAGGVVILEGDQGLVFFLGGIPGESAIGPVCLGFSRVARDPSQRGGARKGPFFRFASRRLAARYGNRFRSFLDPFGEKPYLYFSSNKTRNGYNPSGDTDCPAFGVWPYHDGKDFLNPDTFQIISAGPDRRFGPGTDFHSQRPFFWTAATAADIPPDGRDDEPNFHDRPLGTGR